jgi:hypothetical protein
MICIKPSQIRTYLLTGFEAILVDPGTDRAIRGECFLALSTTYFGLKYHEQAVATRGLSQHGAALQTVHKALADEDASRSFDVLEAVMIMAVIEVCLLNQLVCAPMVG